MTSLLHLANSRRVNIFKREDGDDDDLANKRARELLTLLGLHRLDPGRDYEQFLLFVELLHGLGPNHAHAEMLSLSTHTPKPRNTEQPIGPPIMIGQNASQIFSYNR